MINNNYETDENDGHDVTAEAQQSAARSVGDLVNRIPARRWFAIRRALDMTFEDIIQDPVAMMCVAANEKHRERHGRDDWDTVLNMGLTELTAATGVTGVTSADDLDPDSPGAAGFRVDDAGMGGTSTPGEGPRVFGPRYLTA